MLILVKSSACILCVSLVFSLGCANKSVSNWSEIESADSIGCQELELKSDEIMIDDIFVLGAAGPFLVKVMTNTGNSKYQFVQSSDLVKRDKKKDVIFNRMSTLVHTPSSDGKVVLFTPEKEGKIKLEVRRVPENIEEYSVSLDDNDYSGGQGIFDASGNLYIYLNGGRDDLIFIEGKGKRHAKLEANVNLTFPRFIAGRGNEDIFVIDKQFMDSKEGATREAFAIAKFSKGNLVRAYEYAMPDETGVESWDVTSIGNLDEFYFSYVVGNSLVGDSSLYKSKISLGDTEIYENDKGMLSLGDAHASEPKLYLAGGSPQIALGRWTDHESLLSLYGIDGAKKLEVLNTYGPLEPASSVVYMWESEGESRGIIRYRSENNLKYEYCEI